MSFPTNARQARVWNFLNSGDDFYPIREWPAYLRQNVMSPHRRNRERYTLFFFLVANGLDPTTAGLWTLLSDVSHGHILTEGYDAQAERQVAQMMVQHDDGSLYRERKYMYNMSSGKVEKF